MAERIIPITIESKDELQSPSRSSSPESDKEPCTKLAKSLEVLSVEPKSFSDPAETAAATSATSISHPPQEIQQSTKIDSSSKKVHVKPAPEPPKDKQEYLKRFDVLERRDGSTILSDCALPNSDVLERIILVIDRAQDENYTPFVIGTQRYTPLSTVKRAISILITLKLGINPLHEFAIMVMNENQADLVIDFTHDSKKLTECLNKITECETEDIFNLNTVFNIIQGIDLPQPIRPGLPPPYVLRMIIFYGRSYTLPQLTPNDTSSAFLEHPFCFCDVLMTHEPVETSNHCQKIFDILQNLDQKGIGYFFPVGRHLRRMHKCAGKLLAHPLQRPIQKLIKN